MFKSFSLMLSIAVVGFGCQLTSSAKGEEKSQLKLKARFETKEFSQAKELAKKHHLLLVVSFGSLWCEYCQYMDKYSWPVIEKDSQLKNKAVYLHLDADQIPFLQGTARADADYLQKGKNEYGYEFYYLYPTIRVVSVNDDGTFSVKATYAGSLDAHGLKKFLTESLKIKK